MLNFWFKYLWNHSMVVLKLYIWAFTQFWKSKLQNQNEVSRVPIHRSILSYCKFRLPLLNQRCTARILNCWNRSLILRNLQTFMTWNCWRPKHQFMSSESRFFGLNAGLETCSFSNALTHSDSFKFWGFYSRICSMLCLKIHELKIW